MNILIFIAVLVILILVHELGHFLAARAVGIKVEEFGIGFPPKLASRKRGETVYSLNALPFGGFVKLTGEFATDGPVEPGSFMGATVWRRIIVTIAGVVMNFVLAWLIFMVGYQFGLPAVTQDLTAYHGAVVTESDVQVGRVMDGSAAAQAGLQAGDKLIDATDHTAFVSTTDFQSYTKAHAGQTVTFDIERSGQSVAVTANLGQSDAPLGIEVVANTAVRLPFWSAARAASAEVGGITKSMFQTLWQLVSAPRNSGAAASLSGPVGIYQATATAAQAGGGILVVLVALLSVNLAVLNILPIPALDGGRLLFLVIEAVARRRVVREEVEGWANSIGFILLIGLIILLTARDIVRL